MASVDTPLYRTSNGTEETGTFRTLSLLPVPSPTTVPTPGRFPSGSPFSNPDREDNLVFLFPLKTSKILKVVSSRLVLWFSLNPSLKPGFDLSKTDRSRGPTYREVLNIHGTCIDRSMYVVSSEVYRTQSLRVCLSQTHVKENKRNLKVVVGVF